VRPRDAHIPIVLWVCSAVVAHLCVSGGADQVKEREERLSAERADIRAVVKDVRTNVAGSSGTEIEIVLPPDLDAPAPPPTTTDPEKDDDPEKADKVAAVDPPKTPDKPKPEEAKVDPPKPIDPPKPPPEQPKPPPEEKKDEPKPPPDKPIEVAQIEASKKIAIKQAEANKVANPDADRIATNANKVDEEKMARERVLDQDSAHPTAGTNVRGPMNEVGHSEVDKSGQSEQQDGDPKRAPGEAAKMSTEAHHEAPTPPSDKTANKTTGPTGDGAGQTQAPQDASKGANGGAGVASPDTNTANNSPWSIDPANPGGDGRSGSPGKSSKKRDFVPNVRSPGLPIPGAMPGPLQALGGFQQFEKAVGPEILQKEREALGQKIRQEHRGRLDTNKFERWKPAIENYDPSVKLGDETALNAAENPFAEYLHDIHNRLHPIFGDEFLGSGLASSQGLDDMSLVTHVELVLSKDEGKIVRMGVTKRSGSTVFDAVALEALDRASPFGKAPDIIASPDGNVYLHWEFHRDPFDACSTRNAHPIMLKHAPKLKPNLPLPPVKTKRRGEGSSSDEPPRPLLPIRKK
jgi:hypothetical protein